MTSDPTASPLDLDRAAYALRSAAVGHTLDYRAVTESTMTDARQLAARPDIRSGTIVIAGEQRAGRGRLQRTWEAPADTSLLMSVLLRRDQLPAQPGVLAMIPGLAVAQAVDTFVAGHATVGLKWPNDVVVVPEGSDPAGSAPLCKIAGILIETAFQGETMEYAVVGVGVNVNQGVDELPHVTSPALEPASLRTLTGATINRTELLIDLALRFSELLRQPGRMIVAAWKRRLWTLGRAVTVHQSDGSTWQGLAMDVDAEGRLIVDAGGVLQTVESGDVSLRPGA